MRISAHASASEAKSDFTDAWNKSYSTLLLQVSVCTIKYIRCNRDIGKRESTCLSDAAEGQSK